MDKVTVNGALVSTDVDRLIRIISEKRRVGLNELERLTGMDRRSMDKWVRVLEDEGYISIIYGLTGTNILWLGEGEYRHTDNKELDEAITGLENKPAHEAYDEVFTEISRSGIDAAERRLEDYLRKKRGSGYEYEYESEEDSIKRSILGKLDSRKESEERPVAKAEPAGPEAPPEPPMPESMESENRKQSFVAAAEMIEERVDAIEVAPPAPEEATKPARMTGDSAKVKELVNAYMNEINKERANLEKLKGEKERVYRERYLALESKVEADIASITERILEKEERVLALKERVLELPDKVEEVEKVHMMIERLETDGREALEKTRGKVEKFMETVAASKEELDGKVAETRSKIDAEKARIADLKELSGDVESRVVDLRRAADDTQEQIAKLNSAMKDLLEDLEDATEMKAEITEMVETVGGSVQSKETELDTLEAQMAEIEKVEQWVREYVKDYESKMESITSYVRSGDEELSVLQESAEGAYLKKYLRELDGMTASYDSELNKATADEKDVETKIADSKRRLSELVRDSKEMLVKLRTDHAGIPDFETVRQQTRNKVGAVAQVLAEKETEREMLGEDIQKAHGGRVSALPRPVSSRLARKPVRKAARKSLNKARAILKKKRK